MADRMDPAFLFEGVLFDLGNTLIPFTPRDSMEFVVRWYTSSGLTEEEVPFRTFLELFRSVVKQERKRADETLWESSVEYRSQMIAAMLKKLTNNGSDLFERLSSTHSDSFSACLNMRSSSRYVLNILRSARTLDGSELKVGLISNAMDGRAIRSFLEKEDLERYFDPLIISSEVGMTKPHPEIFEMALDEMDIRPERTVYVGDRYRTDILGSMDVRMKAVYTREYHTDGEPPEGVEINTPTITNILDLLPLLQDPSFADINR